MGFSSMIIAPFAATLRGAVAGAAGTSALNAATYADMACRGRPASDSQEQAVERLAEGAGHPVPGAGPTRENRLEGLGALAGIATGVGLGVAVAYAAPVLTRLPLLTAGVLVGGAAMAASDVPLTQLRVTDPRQWSATDWASDALPHLAYGVVTVATLRALRRR
jgi:hypothetical protein